MFFLSKLHMLIVVLLTWMASWLLDQSLPYFPIEISRAAGSGPAAHATFSWGVLSLVVTLLYESLTATFTHVSFASSVFGTPLFLWPAVMALAWFDDNRHFILHNVAVVAVLLFVTCHVFLGNDTRHHLPVFLCSLTLMGVSVVMKTMVIVYVELQESLWDWRVPLKTASNVTLVVDKIIILMYEGRAEEWHHIRPVFQVTGVLQWLSFYLMASLY